MALGQEFAVTLQHCFAQGMEVSNRLQHRSNVGMRLQQKIASLEDDLVKTLEEKKQLLGDVLGLGLLVWNLRVSRMNCAWWWRS
ncbi:hypothetical protein R6Q59_007476 [Mikania micrantha]